MDIDKKLFSGMTFSKLSEEIYTNSRSKRRDINTLIASLRKLASDRNGMDTLVALLPTIQELFEIGIRNDEQLIKLATIFQRMMAVEARTEAPEDFGLSDEERHKLMQTLQDVSEEAKNLVSDERLEQIKAEMDIDEDSDELNENE